MSVTINIFANHNLCLGDNYSDAIRKIEEGLDLKVGESKEVSGEASDHLLLHTAHAFYEGKSGEGWPIDIRTNLAICGRLTIYKHFIQFEVPPLINSKTHIWRKIIARDSNYWALELWKEQDFDSVLNVWNEAKSFHSMLTKRLGGDTLLYFNDGAMTMGWDLIYSGATMPDLRASLFREKQMYTYKDLEEDRYEFTDADWFYEEI